MRWCCVCVLVQLALVGCGGGGSQPSAALNNTAQEPSPGIFNTQNDPIDHIGSPEVVPGVNSLPLANGEASFSASTAEFTSREDTPLSGFLSVSPATKVTFEMLRTVSNGSLTLEADGQFTYLPKQNFFGDDAFDVYAWKGVTGSKPVTIKLHVLPVPDAPVIVGNIVPVVEQDTDYRVQFAATDADGDPLTYSTVNLPAWLQLDAESGLLHGHPLQRDVGIYTDIEVAANDGTGLSGSVGPFSIEVIDINDSPTINPSQFPSRLDARESVTVSVFPDDPDGDRVRIWTELNDFVDVVVRGGTLEVTAKDVIEVTPINLVVIAEDRLGSESREIIPITLYPLTASGGGRTLIGQKSGAGVHLVVLGDGYKADELDEYELDVWRLIELMKDDPAVLTHFDAWNVHTVPTASADSGIDDNLLEDFRDTEYDAGFFCGGLPRLICADEAKIFSNALAEYPQLHQIVLLVNDPRYGGSGGAVAIASATALDVALHELGHSVAHLADEYIDAQVQNASVPDFVEGAFANVSHHNTPEDVPWSHWITNFNSYPVQPGQPGVGIFEGGFYRDNGIYRPLFNSRMRSNSQNFGAVNGEQWALSVYRMAHPVRDFGPVTTALESNAGENLHFFVAPLFAANLQQVDWELDGELITTGSDRNTLDLLLTAGTHQLTLSVRDRSGIIRKEPPHSASFRWQWDLLVK